VTLRALSVFSGVGGLDLGAEAAGIQVAAFVERNPLCRGILAMRWPGVPIYGDICAVTGEQLDRDRIGRIDMVIGGFPCQPHSMAGKRRGGDDERDLWGETARILREVRPRWAVLENVPGLLSTESGRFFGRVLGDMAALGMDVSWGVWGAADVGASHRRHRVFIVGHLAHA